MTIFLKLFITSLFLLNLQACSLIVTKNVDANSIQRVLASTLPSKQCLDLAEIMVSSYSRHQKEKLLDLALNKNLTYEDVKSLSNDQFADLISMKMNTETSQYNEKFIKSLIDEAVSNGTDEMVARRALSELTQYSSSTSMMSLIQGIEKRFPYDEYTFQYLGLGSFSDLIYYLNGKFSRKLAHRRSADVAGKKILLIDRKTIEIFKQKPRLLEIYQQASNLQFVYINGIDDNINIARLHDPQNIKKRFDELIRSYESNISENYPIANEIQNEMEKLGIADRLLPQYYDEASQTLLDNPTSYPPSLDNFFDNKFLAARLRPKQIKPEDVLNKTQGEQQRARLLTTLVSGSFKSIENMGEALMQAHKKLLAYASDVNIAQSEIGYYISGAGDGARSPQLMGWLYSQVNNIPSDQTLSKLVPEGASDFKLVVVLDDFVGSGASIRSFMIETKDIVNRPEIKVLPLVLAASSKWSRSGSFPDNTILSWELIHFSQESFYQEMPMEVKREVQSVMKGGFSNTNSMLSFEYMSPDNNVDFWTGERGFTTLFLTDPGSAKYND